MKLPRNKNEAILPQSLVDRIQQVVDEASDEMAAENFTSGLKLFEKAWDMIPQPKLDWDFAVLLLGDLCTACIDAGQFKKAKKWHSLLLKTPYTDIDTSPFVLGAEIYFRLGKLDDTVQFLSIADKIGGARALKHVPKDVLEHYRSHATKTGKARMQLDKRLHDRIMKDSKAATKLLDKGRYDAAIVLLQSSIDLLPEPKTQWEAAEWLYAYQGDAYYESEKFDEARACFQMAYNVQEAAPNPFVLLRLGECEFRLGNEQMAAQHLVGAYMLEGDELFSEEPRDIVEFVNRFTS